MLLIHMRTAIHFLLLVQTWGAINLAINKLATQSGDYVDSSGGRLPASTAVDGNYLTFSHTEVSRAVNWWRVDLGAKYTFGSIRIYNRGEPYNDQLRRTSILTSNATSPSTPSLTSNNWTRVTYQGPAYGDVGTHTFNPPIDGQYVAVYNEVIGGIALAEVEVYDYNYAQSKPTGSSSNTAASYNAVDRDLSTVFSTSNEQSPWWKVDLGEAILLREVILFVKVGTQLTNVYFLTNPSNTATEPNMAGYDEWNICRYSQQALDDFHTVQCNIGYQHPLTRLFSIRSSAEIRIELSEVEVCGFELPQLSGNIDGKAVTATSTSITVSFLPWNQLMTGGYPPTEYTVQLSGGESRPVPHNSNSQRLSTTFNGLDAGQTYTFTVTCTIQGIACTGPTHSITANTSCAVPDKPGQITLSPPVERQHDSRQRWEYTATWEAPNKANCAGPIQYQYNLVGESTSALQTTTTATFYLDGDQPFEFAVKAKNSVGFSTPRNMSGRSGILKPQFGSGRISVTAKNSTCVAVTWSEPLYPGGTISQYLYRCSGESWMGAGGDRTKDSCGHLPNTQTTCWVLARNSAGWGTAIQSEGRTNCDVPEFTQTPTYTEEYDNERKRRMVTFKLQGVTAHCATLDPLQYKVLDREFSTDNTIRQLNAITKYNITIKATNYKRLSTSVYIDVMTGELAPWDGPQVLNRFSKYKTCAIVEWKQPLQPNGVIIEYQYQCAREDQSYSIAWTTTTTTSLSDCGYDVENLVKCGVRAATAIGYGPAVELMLNITCDNPSAPVFTLSSYEGIDNSATIQVYLQESTHWCNFLKPYTITIRDKEGEVFHNRTNVTAGKYTTGNAAPFANYTVVIEATNDANLMSFSVQSIMTVETEAPMKPGLELLSSTDCVYLITSKPMVPNGLVLHYTFTCSATNSTGNESKVVTAVEGNGFTRMCGFTSATLVTCSAAAHNSVGIGEESVASIYTQPSTPQPQCQSPPAIENTMRGSLNDEQEGESAVYACEAGYQRIKGDIQLTCKLNDNNEAVWEGSPIVCTKGLSAGLGVGIGVFIVVVGIVGVFAFVKMRKTTSETENQHSAKANELSDYAQLSVIKPSNYEPLRFEEKKPSSEANTNDDYDIVCDETKRDNVYEAPAVAASSDHIYDACSN